MLLKCVLQIFFFYYITKCLLFLLCNIKHLLVCLSQSSIQITFDNCLQFTAASKIDSVTCADQSAHRTVGEKSLDSSQLQHILL